MLQAVIAWQWEEEWSIVPWATTLSLHWASLTPKNTFLHTGIRSNNKSLQPEDKTKVRVQGKMSHMCVCTCAHARTRMHTQRHSSHCVRVYLKEQGSGERSFMDSFVKEKEQQPNQG